MQNDSNRTKTQTESRFRSRHTPEVPSGAHRQAVRQGRIDVVTQSEAAVPSSSERGNTVPRGLETPSDMAQNRVATPGQRQTQVTQRMQEGSERQKQRPPGETHRQNRGFQDVRQKRPPTDGTPFSPRPGVSSERPGEGQRQVVVGKPKSEKTEERKKQPVIIDSPNIDSTKKQNSAHTDSDAKGERKFYFQRLRDISTLRKMLILVFGLLFVLCVAPAFFHIMGIGVISSSAVMLCICLTAMFWHLIDRNWTIKKAVAVIFAAVMFTACVAGFGVVSGMMLKASLTAAPKDCPDYTVVVLGCKVHGDQPSWMLNDRLEKAYAVLSENPNVKCVVTGGMGEDEQFTEGYVMRKYLVEKGISPDRIYVEELASSTEENMLYSKSLIRLNGLSENIVIVTDRFHVLRARMWAEKSGFKNIYSGCCETRLYLVTGYWFREMFGLARLYIFGI